MAITINNPSALTEAFKAISQAAASSSTNEISGSKALDLLTSASSSSSSSGSSLDFTEIMNKAMEQVNTLTNQSTAQENTLLTGEAQDIHSVVIAAEKADIALQMTLQVRNKVLDAYQEMMRMQI